MMLPSYEQSMDVLALYTENKTSWYIAHNYDHLIRPYGEAAYHILDAYQKISQNPQSYRIVKDYLRVLDHHEYKDGNGMPKRNDVNKMIALQSAIGYAASPESPIHDNIYSILKPPTYKNLDCESDITQAEYMEAILKPDFYAPSPIQTLKDMTTIVTHTDIIRNRWDNHSLSSYYEAAQTLRKKFKNGFSYGF
jgi:hypothetical protein